MNAPTRREEKAGNGRDWTDLLSPTGDELDRLAVDEISKLVRLGRRVSALDCDCGLGGQALRMAQAGAYVLATDRDDRRATLEDAASSLGVGSRIRFMQIPSMCHDTTPLPGTPFDIAICHRSLPNLPYNDALTFVRRVLLMTRTGGKIFLSAYGIHSELGDHYPDNEKRVKERFADLAPEIAAKYAISGPVCLYSERDLFLLLFAAGASVLRTFTTTHGNVKAIAVRV